LGSRATSVGCGGRPVAAVLGVDDVFYFAAKTGFATAVTRRDAIVV
jgi:hypothetical protein